jgi:hypothetical protein
MFIPSGYISPGELLKEMYNLFGCTVWVKNI